MNADLIWNLLCRSVVGKKGYWKPTAAVKHDVNNNVYPKTAQNDHYYLPNRLGDQLCAYFAWTECNEKERLLASAQRSAPDAFRQWTLKSQEGPTTPKFGEIMKLTLVYQSTTAEVLAKAGTLFPSLRPWQKRLYEFVAEGKSCAPKLINWVVAESATGKTFVAERLIEMCKMISSPNLGFTVVECSSAISLSYVLPRLKPGRAIWVLNKSLPPATQFDGWSVKLWVVKIPENNIEKSFLCEMPVNCKAQAGVFKP